MQFIFSYLQFQVMNSSFHVDDYQPIKEGYCSTMEHKCSKCRKDFITRDGFLTHMRTVHPLEPIITLENVPSLSVQNIKNNDSSIVGTSGSGITTESVVDNTSPPQPAFEINMSNNSLNIYSCATCGEDFGTEKSLAQHAKSHFGWNCR